MVVAFNRRDFLAKVSCSLSGMALGLYPGRKILLPTHGPDTAWTANELLENAGATPDLTDLATHAIDAATSAGASFADIRIARKVRLGISRGDEAHGRGTSSIWLTPTIAYGIRVVANGALSFVHGCIADRAGIAAAAQTAVATARGYATAGAKPVELAPTTPARGKWQTPIATDPFAIALREQLDLLWAWQAAAERVVDGSASGIGFLWTKEIRVFASSEGALTEQTLCRSEPHIGCNAERNVFPAVFFELVHLPPSSAGYESVLLPDIEEQITAVTEEAMEISRLPERRFDVGRYPVVFDGWSLGSAFSQTVGQALDLDRVLGYEADAGGTSFLAPPEEILGKLTINPLLSVTADRALPHVEAVKWDDEGVEVEAHSLIEDGLVVDYHTSRQTAPALAAWYHARERPVRSHGCATATEADQPPMVRAPHMTIAPGKQRADVEDLCQHMTKGLVVRQLRYVSTDSAFATGAIHSAGAILEVARGKIVGRVRDVGLLFDTRKFWHGLEALGDDRTVGDSSVVAVKGYPWWNANITTSAPAGLFQSVNVINTSRVL